MNNKRTMILLGVGLALLLTLQLFAPVFTGDAVLNLPDRIRTFFSEIFGGEEDGAQSAAESELPPVITLDEQPEGHNETPMQTLGEADRVELPPDETETPSSQPEQVGENELPMDRFD